MKDKREQTELTRITKEISNPTLTMTPSIPSSGKPAVSISPSVSPPNSIDWNKAQEINQEITGYLEITNTNIEYFFTQTTDNSYYLTHDLKKKESKYGAIFLDCRNASDFTSQNSILYGHNMKDGSIFHNLRYYKTEKYYKKHPEITIYKKESNLYFQIFSAYVVDADTESIPVTFSSEQEFVAYIKNCKKRSIYNTNISVTDTKQILTLVTCSYETDNSRLLVQGKLISD